MTQNELSECKREVVLVHTQWKNAVAVHDVQLAASLDSQCRELRTKIIAANRISKQNQPV